MDGNLQFEIQYDGGEILDIGNIKMKPYEAPEDLYRRLLKCVERNLLPSNFGISHHGEMIDENEKISPSLENLVVFMWLNLLHKDLPTLVKKKFETLLHTNTLASIRPRISQSLHQLLGEILSSYSEIDITADELTKLQQPIMKTKNPPLRCHLCKQTGSLRHDSAKCWNSLHGGKPSKSKRSNRKDSDTLNYTNEMDAKQQQKRTNKKHGNSKSKRTYSKARYDDSVGSQETSIGNNIKVSGKKSADINSNNDHCAKNTDTCIDSHSYVANDEDKDDNVIISDMNSINKDYSICIDTGSDLHVDSRTSRISPNSTDVYVFNDFSSEIKGIDNVYDTVHENDQYGLIHNYDENSCRVFCDENNINNRITNLTEIEDNIKENLSINKNGRLRDFDDNDIRNIDDEKNLNDETGHDGNKENFYHDIYNDSTRLEHYDINTDDLFNQIDYFDNKENIINTDDGREVKGDITSTSVSVKQSPFFHAYYKKQPLKITIDSGAETNMIRECLARQIGLIITNTSQQATQADGQSPLTIVGETRMNLTRNAKCFYLEALVVENIDVDILAGVPFMTCNDVSVRPAKQQIIIGDGTIYEYGAITLNIDTPPTGYVIK